MKQIFLIPCIFFVLLTTANTQEIFKCTDANGNAVLTSSPQDGMKCVRGESDEEPKSRKISSKKNLLDACTDLSRELDDISDEMTTLDRRRSELQREQLEIRQNAVANNWNYRIQSEKSKSVNAKLSKLSSEYSILSQKKSIIYQDMGMYKCHELNSDLSKLNQKNYQTNRGSRYRNR